MQATLNALPSANSTQKSLVWTGRILSALPVLFLVMDGAIKLVNIQPVVDASLQLGLPVDLAPRLGLLLLACVAVYLVPRTSALGALLLTGYLGGAIAIHARSGSEMFSLVFPIILGVLIWGGLALRDSRVRALFLGR